MADITAALEFGPGHVWLIFDTPVSVDAMIYITRDNQTAANLGPRGWQSQPFAIDPIRIEPFLDGARVLLGPDIVDYVDQGEMVAVNTGGVTYRKIWPSVEPGNHNLRRFALEEGGLSSTRQATGFKTAPTIQHMDDQAPIVQSPNHNSAYRNENSNHAVDGAMASEEKHLRDDAPQKSWVLALIIIVILACLGGGGYMIYNSFIKPSTQNGQMHNGQTAGQAQGGKGGQQSPNDVLKAGQTQLQHDLALGPDGWNQLIAAKDTDPQRLFELGRALRNQAGGNLDIGFEAIYRAVQKGNRDALQWYANANDVSSGATGNDQIIPPNIRRSFESWTVLAQQGGDAKAQITRLCENLRTKRFNGTAEERTTFQDYCQ